MKTRGGADFVLALAAPLCGDFRAHTLAVHPFPQTRVTSGCHLNNYTTSYYSNLQENRNFPNFLTNLYCFLGQY